MYIAITNKISIADMKNNYSRIQTIAHECIHSVQNRRLLLCNFIVSNINIIYIIAISILTYIGKIQNTMFQLFILSLFLIISFVTKSVFDKVSNKLSGAFKGYVNETAKQQAEISRQNDLKIKEKQAAARTTSYVKCPKCGSDNIISDKFSRCKYCRSALENKNYK